MKAVKYINLKKDTHTLFSAVSSNLHPGAIFVLALTNLNSNYKKVYKLFHIDEKQ